MKRLNTWWRKVHYIFEIGCYMRFINRYPLFLYAKILDIGPILVLGLPIWIKFDHKYLLHAGVKDLYFDLYWNKDFYTGFSAYWLIHDPTYPTTRIVVGIFGLCVSVKLEGNRFWNKEKRNYEKKIGIT